jgi:hypothetical protein
VNKFERMKHEKDGLDVYPDLMRAAVEGWEVLDDDDTARLKWYGLYPHNTRDGHFMLRVKVVQGVLTATRSTRWRRSPTTTAAASSTARRASACRSTGSASRTSRTSSRASTSAG